jgi:hypothetical protein
VDVPPSNAFFLEINWLGSAGITKGCNPPGNDRFCPESFVTRGEMAAFLTRALELKDDGGYDWFLDDNGTLFESEIDRLAAAGITKGCNPPDNDRFCPESFLTRGEMAAFLFRGMAWTEARIELTAELTPPPPYHAWDTFVAVLGVANTGNVPFVEVSVEPMHDCWVDDMTGPSHGVGDTDAMLEPGERWDYECHGQAGHGVLGFTVLAEGLGGSTIEEHLGLTYIVAHPIEVVVNASEISVSPGTVVTFSATATNVGAVAVDSVSAVGRLIEEGNPGPWPYFPMAGPVHLVGNSDDLLEPGEMWEWVEAETINSDAYFDVDVAVDPVTEPGSHYGFHGQSEVVRVIEVVGQSW